VDLYEKVTGVYPSFMQYRVTEIRVRSLNADKIGYIDAVYIGQKAVTDPGLFKRFKLVFEWCERHR
jgi:hypothetical protein